MKDEQLLDLVKRSIQKDPEAFSLLLEHKEKEIVYLCICEMRNHHDGEDAAQEVFLQMQRSITQLRAPESFNAWMCRIIRFTCAKQKRKFMKRNEMLCNEAEHNTLLDIPEEHTTHTPLEDYEHRREISRMIENLDDKYKTCVVLHYYQGLSYADIAQTLDISVDSVNNNLRIARKKLKKQWEREKKFEKFKDSQELLMAMGLFLGGLLNNQTDTAATLAMVNGCINTAFDICNN